MDKIYGLSLKDSKKVCVNFKGYHKDTLVWRNDIVTNYKYVCRSDLFKHKNFGFWISACIIMIWIVCWALHCILLCFNMMCIDFMFQCCVYCVIIFECCVCYRSGVTVVCDWYCVSNVECEMICKVLWYGSVEILANSVNKWLALSFSKGEV